MMKPTKTYFGLVLGLSFALMLLLVQPGWTHGGQALSKETLKKLFPQADNFVTKPLGLSADQRQKIEARLGAKLEDHDLKAPAYIASSKGRSVGIIWATDAHLKKGNVDVIVGVGLDGKVSGVVLDHSKVSGLDKPAYLDQYKKLTTRPARRLDWSRAEPGVLPPRPPVASLKIYLTPPPSNLS